MIHTSCAAPAADLFHSRPTHLFSSPPRLVPPLRMAEFRKWCPLMRVVRLHVNDEGERKRLRQDVLGDPSSFDVAVTT